jgi:hypothetical protein
MKAEFRTNINPPKGERVGEVLGQPVIELASSVEVAEALDLVIENVNPDVDNQPAAYLDAIVLSEERLGARHTYPVKLMGREALTVMVALAKGAAEERDKEAGRLPLAA